MNELPFEKREGEWDDDYAQRLDIYNKGNKAVKALVSGQKEGWQVAQKDWLTFYKLMGRRVTPVQHKMDGRGIIDHIDKGRFEYRKVFPYACPYGLEDARYDVIEERQKLKAIEKTIELLEGLKL